MLRGLGYKRDLPKGPGETPDLVFGAGRATPLPPSADLSRYVVKVLDQGRLGSCVANGGMGAIRISAVRQVSGGAPAGSAALEHAKAAVPLGSRLFGYYFARAIDNPGQSWRSWAADDSGTHPRSFFRAVNKVGFPTEDVLPYSDDSTVHGAFAEPPLYSALAAAYDTKAPTDYFRIASSGAQRLQDLKQALVDGYPVVFGCEVDEAFCQGDFDASKDLAPVPSAKSVGGHCMVFVGYEGSAFRVLNSWSEEWGDGGYCWFSSDYVLECGDLWAVRHSPIVGEK